MNLNSKPILVALTYFAGVSAAYAQFSPAANGPFFSGHNPVAIVSADFNRDSIPDLAIVNQGDGTITILLGDSKGNFNPSSTGPTLNGVFPVGTNPSAIVAGDFDHDGNTDLAVANIDDNSVIILKGDEKANFTQIGEFSTGRGPVAMVTADFDGDGNLDIAVLTLDDQTAAIAFGDGHGGFSTKIKLATGKFPIALVAADLDASGLPDLAVADEGDATICVFMDPANATSSAPTLTLKSLTPMQTVSGVTAANFTGHLPAANGLSYLDLMVTYYETNFSGNLLLFTADESGGYNSPLAPFLAKTFGLQPVAVEQGAFTRGSSPIPLPGIAIADYRSGTLAIFEGDGMGNLAMAPNGPYPTGTLPRAIAVADFNGDGLDDVAVANYNDGTVSVLLNTFATAPVMVSAASLTGPVASSSAVNIQGTGLISLASPNGTTVDLTDGSGVVWKAIQPTSATSTMVNLQVPALAAAGSGSFTVHVPGADPQKAPVVIAAVAPGLYSANTLGKGPADGYALDLVSLGGSSLSNCTATAPPVCTPNAFDVSGGTTELVLFGTGIRNRSQLSSVTVTAGGISVPVFYAGPRPLPDSGSLVFPGQPTVPGTLGVDQINVVLPASLAHAGTIYVQVAITGSAPSNQVTISIK